MINILPKEYLRKGDNKTKQKHITVIGNCFINIFSIFFLKLILYFILHITQT